MQVSPDHGSLGDWTGYTDLLWLLINLVKAVRLPVRVFHMISIEFEVHIIANQSKRHLFALLLTYSSLGGIMLGPEFNP